MSGVDVLTHMSVAAKRLRIPGTKGMPAGPLTALLLDEARAAVAELIAAAADLQKGGSDEKRSRLTAALARCGGAA